MLTRAGTCPLASRSSSLRRLLRWSVNKIVKVNTVKVETEAWDRVVAHAAPHDRIVQLYQDQDFLNRAVCRFAGAALEIGEGIILVPTLTHWNADPDSVTDAAQR